MPGLPGYGFLDHLDQDISQHLVGPLLGGCSTVTGCCTGTFQHCPAAVEVAGLLKKVVEHLKPRNLDDSMVLVRRIGLER